MLMLKSLPVQEAESVAKAKDDKKIKDADFEVVED